MLARRIRRASAGLAVGLVAVALSPPAAHAYDNYYCGVLINSGSWCGDGSNHSYDSNRAYYTGSGSVYVCERLVWPETTTARLSPKCAYNDVIRYYSTSSTSYWEAEVTHYSGNARHTTYGHGVY